MQEDIKLIEILGDSQKTEIFNGDIAHLIVTVANMLDLNVYEVIVKKK